MASAKTIKGITIEIAGDATKLGKALKDVDATSNDLAASLKYVDRLLDLDPGNTELIAEKQHILADSIDNTSKRLETLRSVQEKVNQQYADGEIGQRAYLDFQSELLRTEKKLQNLRGENDKLETSLSDAGDEARDTAEDLDRLKAASDNAADAGDTLAGSFESFIVGGLAGFSIGNIVSIISELAESTEEYREEMSKLDVSYSNANLSAEAADEAYRILYRTLGETDQSVEAAQQIALLADSTEDVVAWASLAPGVVATFGDALQPETFFEAANETLKLGEATGAYVQLLEGTGYSVEAFNEGLAACNTEQEKQQYMLGVTNGLLGDAAAEYEERNKSVMESRDADARMTEALGQMGEAIAPVITDFKNFSAGVLEWFVPAVEIGAELIGVICDEFGRMGEDLTMLWHGLFGTSESMVEFSDTAADTAENVSQLANNAAEVPPVLEKIEDAYAEAYSGAQSSIDSQIGLFTELGDESDISAEKIIENWEKQADAFDNYSANLQKAVDMGLDEALVQQLSDGSQQSMQILNEFVNGTEISVEEINAAFLGTSEARENLAITLTDMQLAADETYQEMLQDASSLGEDVVENWSNTIDEMKGLTDFKWSLPKPSVPKFDISGGFSFSPPTVPKVSVTWNAQGGILTGPTLFGALGGNLLGGGEAGQEAVLPLDSFYDRLESILADRGTANPQLIVNFDIAHFENRTEQDLNELTEAVGHKLYIIMERRIASIA